MRDPAIARSAASSSTAPALPKRSRADLALYFDPDRGVVPKQGEIDIKGFTQVIQVMAEAGELAPPLPQAERFIDLQYLKAAGLQ